MEWIKANPTLIPVSVMALVAIGGVLIAIGKWLGRRESFESIISGFKESLENSMKEIRGDIKNILRSLPPTEGAAVKGASPLRLTELGESISETIQAPAWAQNEVGKVLSRTREMGPYGVQQFCFDYVDEVNYSPDLMQRMQDCAYNKGTTLIEVKKVLAIELRDRILASPGR